MKVELDLQVGHIMPSSSEIILIMIKFLLRAEAFPESFELLRR